MTTFTPVRRTAAVAATLAIVMTPAVRSSAQADRPDLLDVPEVRFVDGEDSLNSAFVVLENQYYYYPVSGASCLETYTDRDRPARGALVGLFEPDKTKRKGNKLSLKQSDFVALRVSGGTPDGYFSGIGLVPGCKANVKVFERGGGPEQHQRGKVSVKCKRSPDPLTMLGLSAAERARFEKVFGSTAIKIKGQRKPRPPMLP